MPREELISVILNNFSDWVNLVHLVLRVESYPDFQPEILIVSGFLLSSVHQYINNKKNEVQITHLFGTLPHRVQSSHKL